MAVRGRQPANGTSNSISEPNINDAQGSSSTSTISGLLTTPVVNVDRDEVKVNNASVTEMKHACDDALKRVSGYISPFHAHTLRTHVMQHKLLT